MWFGVVRCGAAVADGRDAVCRAHKSGTTFQFVCLWREHSRMWRTKRGTQGTNESAWRQWTQNAYVRSSPFTPSRQHIKAYLCVCILCDGDGDRSACIHTLGRTRLHIPKYTWTHAPPSTNANTHTHQNTDAPTKHNGSPLGSGSRLAMHQVIYVHTYSPFKCASLLLLLLPLRTWAASASRVDL